MTCAHTMPGWSLNRALPVQPSVLAVTSELPWPLDSGGHLRSYYLLGALSQSYRVTLVTTAANSVPTAPIEERGIAVRVARNAHRSPVLEAGRALRAAIRAEAYVMYRRHDWRAVRRMLALEARRNPPDILYLDHLDSFVYSSVAPGALTVCDLHNVYSLLAARAAAEQRHVLRRAYLAREARLLERTEARVARHVDLVLTCSELEEQYFARAGARRVRVVPNGVDSDRYASLPSGRRVGPPVVMFVGSMSWQPNASAARFLALNVLPALRARLPDARVRIVGRDPPQEVLALTRHPGVEVTGRVEDVLPHLREAHALAVPLEAGGGTRLKILEAFAAGLPVVSTPVGCEGIRADPDRHLIVAPRERFADVLTDLLLSPGRARSLAEAARGVARELYDWRVVGRSAVAAIEHVRNERTPSSDRAPSPAPQTLHDS